MELAKRPAKKKDPKIAALGPVAQYKILDNINPGSYPVPAIVIYDRYRKWAVINNEEVLSQVKFFKELKLHFQKKMHKTEGASYMLDPVGFDLTPEHRQKLIDERPQSKGLRNNGKKKSNKEDNS